MEQKTLRNFLKDNMKQLIVPLCMIALGIILIIKPVATMATIAAVIGWILIIAGVVTGFSLLAAYSPMVTAFAVILLLAGIIIVLNPVGVSTFVVKIFGLCILINACFRIHDAILIRGTGDKYWSSYIANDVITAVLGFVLLFLSFSVAKTVIVIVGIVMAVLGVTNIFTAYKVYKVGKYINDGSDVVWEE